MSRIITMSLFGIVLAGLSVDASAAYDATAGKSLYESSCRACHKRGIFNAPIVGDQAAWAPRIAKGIETLAEHADLGFTGKNGIMPAKGGTSASTVAIGNTTAYMVEQSK